VVEQKMLEVLSVLEKLDVPFGKWTEDLAAIREAKSLSSIVRASWKLGLGVGKEIVEQELKKRAEQPNNWPTCAKCGKGLRSKGMRPRQIETLLGRVSWSRRVGRCPDGCKETQIAPLDQFLEIEACQQTSWELVQMGCLLAVFLPFETVRVILHQLTGVEISAKSVWNWVQSLGKQAMVRLEMEMNQLAKGNQPTPEEISETIAKMTLIIGADGVMIPMRRHLGKPDGKTQWREVKVAILSRIGKSVSRKGREFLRLHQRRLVAVLGDIDALRPRLMLEALRQQWQSAPKVVWISDGGKGFWGLYQQCFAQGATAILDFYHAAQNLWKGASAAFDGRTTKARKWFESLRHKLRHGQQAEVIAELAETIEFKSFSDDIRKTLTNVHNYLNKHQSHINYQHYKELGLPLGSGMVESACKWLIQQRFKGVGMRWSEPGFNHLLHLRLAWVNGRFDELFSDFSSASPKP